MARARGANAQMAGKFESVYGTPPTGNYMLLPFVSSALGEEQGLIESDLLGQGREPYDPTLDVANNDGDVVVPVDVRAFGQWLKLMFGTPGTAAASDLYVHTFESGATALPSMSLQIGMPEVPSYGMNFGVRGNTLRIGMGRSGLLNATLGLIARGETISGSNGAGTPTSVIVDRFAQAKGEITKDGVALGNVVSAEFAYSNNLDKVETIRPDSRIEDADPGMAAATGSIVVRFADHTLLDAATGSDPIALTFGWEKGDMSLLFTLPRVFLPKPKRPIAGPAGIQATFAFQASGQSAALCTAALTNDVASYA